MAEMITVDFQNSFIFILLCLFSLLCYYLLFVKKPKQFDFPPSPPSLPIIGHLHLLLSNLTHKSFQKLSSKYGPLLHLRIFNVSVVLVSSTSMAYEIFRTNDLSVASRGLPLINEANMAETTGYVTAPYGDYWKFMKKFMLTKLLGPHALEKSREARAEELKSFYKGLLNKAMKKERIEIRKEAMKLTNNSICKMIMGRSCSEENGEAERVRGLVSKTFDLTKKIFLANMLRTPLEKLGISLFHKEIMNVTGKFDEVLERMLGEHEEKPEDHQGIDMMDLVLAAYRDENAEFKITRSHMKSFFADLFVAGTDSSSQTIQWIMAEIINNPKILEKLREEIDSVVGKTRLIQETDLPNLPYLQAVVKEGLRLHPSAPLVTRSSREGFKIGRFYIPEKTTVVVNAYVVMRDPEVWEDPEEFKPERFLSGLKGGEDEKEQAMKYIPFGGGRRGCPGSNLAYIFVGTAIGVMVQGFDWEIKGDKVKMEEDSGGLNLTMAHPLNCTPVARIHL